MLVLREATELLLLNQLSYLALALYRSKGIVSTQVSLHLTAVNLEHFVLQCRAGKKCPIILSYINVLSIFIYLFPREQAFLPAHTQHLPIPRSFSFWVCLTKAMARHLTQRDSFVDEVARISCNPYYKTPSTSQQKRRNWYLSDGKGQL